MFPISKTTYFLSSSISNRTWAAKLDAEVKEASQDSLPSACSHHQHFLLLPGAMGGLGLTSVEDNLGSNVILKVMKGLSSKDRLLCDMAWD